MCIQIKNWGFEWEEAGRNPVPDKSLSNMHGWKIWIWKQVSWFESEKILPWLIVNVAFVSTYFLGSAATHHKYYYICCEKTNTEQNICTVWIKRDLTFCLIWVTVSIVPLTDVEIWTMPLLVSSFPKNPTPTAALKPNSSYNTAISL